MQYNEVFQKEYIKLVNRLSDLSPEQQDRVLNSFGDEDEVSISEWHQRINEIDR